MANVINGTAGSGHRSITKGLENGISATAEGEVFGGFFVNGGFGENVADIRFEGSAGNLGLTDGNTKGFIFGVSTGGDIVIVFNS